MGAIYFLEKYLHEERKEYQSLLTVSRSAVKGVDTANALALVASSTVWK